jgi:hypothetical protein
LVARLTVSDGVADAHGVKMMKKPTKPTGHRSLGPRRPNEEPCANGRREA